MTVGNKKFKQFAHYEISFQIKNSIMILRLLAVSILLSNEALAMRSRLHGEEQMKANVLEDPSPIKFAETESVPVYSRHHQRKMLA